MINSELLLEVKKCMRFQLAQLKAQISGPISIHNEGGQVTTNFVYRFCASYSK